MSKTEIWQGTLALMIHKTLDTLGPLHGYGIARRIEQISGDRRLIRREAGALAVAGIVIGSGCAILAASLMRKLLFGTPPYWAHPHY